ncbi:glycosyltransferase [Brevibacillus invocatus]|uniref:glycosyltransferase n=1 Tax=Brevibacillus invocatus TaxID=173959 RepID=UPI002041DC68|nr:glycosyltransferase [Brevibacillus invocatus]MCM3082094.1 glycosyltransferase family 2 protein [Brevibacillus invocatus]MCM3432505.1 glycosyltransferase family 2 protein [Brevibacillus invocatus]
MNQIDVSVIIPARDDSRWLHAIIQEIRSMAQSAEVIVVCHQPSPVTMEQIQKYDATLIYADKAITYDEGRGIGALHASGNVLLFLDDQVVRPYKQLEKLLKHIEKGSDIVLSRDLNPASSDQVLSRKMTYHLLNHIVRRQDLGSASLYEVPFAMTRKAVDHVDPMPFIPAVILVESILQKLTVRAIPAIIMEKRRTNAGQTMNSSSQKVLDEHAQAMSLWMQQRGERNGLWDGDRYRPLLQVSGSLHLRSVYRSHEWEILQGRGWDEKRRSKKAASIKKNRKHALVKGKQTALKRDHRGSTGRKNR